MKIYLIALPQDVPHAINQIEAAFELDLRTVRHETAGPDLTRTALDVELRAPQITPEVAAHVLAHFGAGGYHAGSYTRDLIMLIARADPSRRRRLALAEPAYVLAVGLAQDTATGVETLQTIARSGRTAVIS
ncbi:hypothetical protein GCM10022254_09230 [Actinomadura meridiana]|uniref:Uncharacterized protein n=1 Tax=Actinomadura meridiana TaxID=559626 RepID=A0ABP8BTL6_9ACTN